MDNTSLPILRGNPAAFHLESQVPPPPTHALPTPPESSDDSDKSDDTTSVQTLTSAEIKLKRKFDSTMAALNGATKDLEKIGRPGLLDLVGCLQIEEQLKGMRRREAAWEERQLLQDDSGESRLRSIPMPETTMVDTLSGVIDMLHTMSSHISLATSSSHAPTLSIDTEGPLSLLQLMVIKPHRFWNDEWADRVWRESGRRLSEGDAGWKANHAPAGWDKIKQVDRTAAL
jgi:hypothetical protein